MFSFQSPLTNACVAPSPGSPVLQCQEGGGRSESSHLLHHHSSDSCSSPASGDAAAGASGGGGGGEGGEGGEGGRSSSADLKREERRLAKRRRESHAARRQSVQTASKNLARDLHNADLNKDEYITAAELRLVSGVKEAVGAATVEDVIDAFDEDGDGMLSKRELNRMRQSIEKNMLAAADAADAADEEQDRRCLVQMQQVQMQQAQMQQAQMQQQAQQAQVPPQVLRSLSGGVAFSDDGSGAGALFSHHGVPANPALVASSSPPPVQDLVACLNIIQLQLGTLTAAVELCQQSIAAASHDGGGAGSDGGLGGATTLSLSGQGSASLLPVATVVRPSPLSPVLQTTLRRACTPPQAAAAAAAAAAEEEETGIRSNGVAAAVDAAAAAFLAASPNVRSRRRKGRGATGKRSPSPALPNSD